MFLRINERPELRQLIEMSTAPSAAAPATASASAAAAPASTATDATFGGDRVKWAKAKSSPSEPPCSESSQPTIRNRDSVIVLDSQAATQHLHPLTAPNAIAAKTISLFSLIFSPSSLLGHIPYAPDRQQLPAESVPPPLPVLPPRLRLTIMQVPHERQRHRLHRQALGQQI